MYAVSQKYRLLLHAYICNDIELDLHAQQDPLKSENCSRLFSNMYYFLKHILLRSERLREGLDKYISEFPMQKCRFFIFIDLRLMKWYLKGHSNEADFLGVLHKPVRHTRSLTLHFEPFRFGFEFAGIFIIEKRLPDSPSQGVDKIDYRYNFFQTFN